MWIKTPHVKKLLTLEIRGGHKMIPLLLLKVSVYDQLNNENLFTEGSDFLSAV